MNLKDRISSFINQLLTQYGIRQKDLAEILGISLGRIHAYITAKELPRADVLLKLADIGGVTMDDLLKSDKTPQKKEISIKISTGDKSPVTGVTGDGDVYINTTVKRVYKYTYQPGDLTEEQVARLQALVDEIINLESTVKRKPKSHAAVWNALKRKFRVAYYRKIHEEDFKKAESYLNMWRGRLTKPLSKKNPQWYKRKRYAGIFAHAKNQLGWTKEEVDNFIFAEFGVPSIRSLTDDQLESLYSRIMVKK